jgi:hypothetical protein
MVDDSTLNDNLMTKKLALSHIDIVSPKASGFDFKLRAKKENTDKASKLKASIKKGLETQLDKKK